MKKIFCFDFDGTIADTLPLIVDSANKFFTEEKGKGISDSFLRKVREEGIEEVFRETNIPLYRLFFIYLKIKKEMNREITEAKVNESVKEVVKEMKRRGHMVGILTSNSERNVVNFLKHHDFEVFDFIKTAGIFGKKREIEKLKENGRDLFYIGDETRDIKAGKRAKVKTVAVPWGLSSKEALQKAKPDILIERPEDLLDLSP